MKKICFLFICFFIIACPGIVIAGEEGNSEDYSSLIDGIYEQGQIYKLDMYTNDNSFYELF